MATPIICFGQQPCGIFPRRFLYAKIQTARRLQGEIGGEIVFFYHDSDHDPRETITILRDRQSGREQRFNFQFANKLQKQFSPLFAKRVLPEWQDENRAATSQLCPAPTGRRLCKKVAANNVADFCLEMYRRLGLLEGLRVMRSGDPELSAARGRGRRLLRRRDLPERARARAQESATAFCCTRVEIPT